MRRFHALYLARLLTPHSRWIPSEVNYSDEASRITDDSRCKSILHLLRVGESEIPRSRLFSSCVDGQIAWDSDAGPRGCQATKYSSAASPMPDKLSLSFQNATSTQCQSATRFDSKSQTASARSTGCLRKFSESECMAKSSARKRNRTVNGGRARHRVRKYIKFFVEGENGADTFFENAAVTVASNQQYRKAVDAWLLWCDNAWMKFITASQTDWAVSTLMSQQYLSRISLLGRREVADGPHVHGAGVWAPRIQSHAPGSSGLEGLEATHTWTQPTSSSRTNLEKRWPARSPRGESCKWAFFFLISLSAYLPPGEGLGLRRGDIVRPAANIPKFWASIMCPENMVARTRPVRDKPTSVRFQLPESAARN